MAPMQRRARLQSPGKDTLRIMVASDNHVGFMEHDPIRGEDSFRAFEEILNIAKDNDVDLILLGGDLFHDNKPSQSTLYRTMELLRRHCLSDHPIRFQILSDQAKNFRDRFGRANFEDEHYNIGTPVFTIHGNHDDPTGTEQRTISAVDLLAVSNLVNYFGKTDKVDDVTVNPILIAKGDCKVAIYGLGNIRDERLHRTFQNGGVKFARPEEYADEWFNIFVLHQNRVNHSPKNCIHESMLRGFLDFVIWGHEHECRIEPEKSVEAELEICQPGSSVATSLIEGESKQKKVMILDIQPGSYSHQLFPLESVRPFYYRDVVLSSFDLNPADPKVEDAIFECLENEVRSILEEHEKSLESRPDKTPKVPLIRLRVEHSGFMTISPSKFARNFLGKVANPDTIIAFHKKRAVHDPTKKPKNGVKNEELADMEFDEEFLPSNLADEGADRVPTLVQSILNEKNSGLSVLENEKLADAIRHYVEKEEKKAIHQFVDSTLKDLQKDVKGEMDKSETAALNIEEEQGLFRTVVDQLAEAKAKERARLKKEEEKNTPTAGPSNVADSSSEDEPSSRRGKGKVKRRRSPKVEPEDEDDMNDEPVPESPPAPPRSTRGGGSSSKRAAAVILDDSDEHDSDDAEPEPPRKKASLFDKLAKSKPKAKSEAKPKSKAKTSTQTKLQLGRAKPKAKESSTRGKDDDSAEEEVQPMPPPKRQRRPLPGISPKKAPTTASRSTNHLAESSDESDEETTVSSTPASAATMMWGAPKKKKKGKFV